MYLLPHDVKEILNEYINKYFLSKNGIVDSYLDSSMRYDDEERRVSLLKNGEEYSIRNVGSKSNYMFLHLCFSRPPSVYNGTSVRTGWLISVY